MHLFITGFVGLLYLYWTENEHPLLKKGGGGMGRRRDRWELDK